MIMDRNKPIYRRNNTPIYQHSTADFTAAVLGTDNKPTKPITPFHPEAIEQKQLLHNEDWMFERKGRPVWVKFHDGEKLLGTMGRIRKFTFVIDTDEDGSVMVYKAAVKYLSEVK
jgi:sRNA-binding regulator protein Hfq